ncbi:hypothetical protein ACQ4PT_021790 [Festuca glaucescens]
MNKDNDRRSRLRLPQVSGVVQETSTSAAAAAAPNACAAKNSTVDPSRNAAPKPTPARRFKLGRNRASPARLFKLNKILVQAQKDLIEEWGWGGMLKVVAKEMPVDLSMWVLSCFDPIRSELAIPGRGSIPVTADSYTRIFGIRNEGMPICYEMETEPIKFMNEEYGIESGSAPDFGDWCKMISDMGGVADMKFLRAYFAGFRRLNFAQFAIDQIIAEVKKGVKKKSVCCCLHHLVILYLDSLVVDEPVATDEECPIRAAAWNDKLIQIVMHKDSKGNGEFGKLRGLIRRTRRKAEEERLAKLHTDQEHDKDDAPNVSDWSPFSELRELVGSEIRCGIDLPYIEPPEIFDNDSHLYAKAVFMNVIQKDHQSSLESDPPLTTFGSDEAIQKLTAECFNLHRSDMQVEQQKKKSFRQKQVVHRECPVQLQKRSRVSANDTGKSTIPVTLQTEPAPAKVSTNIPDGTTNLPKQNKHVTAVADTRAQANVEARGAAKLKMPTVRPTKPNQQQSASSSVIGHQQNPQVVPHCAVPPMPPSRVLEESNPILPDPAKASTTIADETTNMQKQNKHVTACADARAQANVDVPIAANHKMPTARPPKANQLQPASSRGTEHQQIPQVMPHCGVPPSKVIQAPQKHAPLPQGIPANREATCPTRESCPPPEPKIKNLDEVTRKRAMLARAPDAPSFDLGFDSPAKFGTYPSYSCGITPVDLDAECFGSEEDDWDETTWKEACDAVDKVEREKGYRQEQPSTDNSFVVPGSGFKTPVVSNTVMELGIESIMLRKDRNVKKIVMPLRVTHLLKDLERNEKELKKHFNKATAHLDRKDSVSDTIFTASKVGSVMLPVLEDLAPDANEPVNHYWLFVINIRDRRFEVLDSIRSLSDRKLAQNVEDILSSVHALWDQYYANSPVKLSRFEGPEDIKPPKQGTK